MERQRGIENCANETRGDGTQQAMHQKTLSLPLSLCVCVSCLSVCVSVCVQCSGSYPCLSFVISWFPNSTFPICLFEPWRRQPCAGLPSPRQAGRLIRVGFFNSGQVTEDGPPCLGARFRARAAVTREQPHTASTTGSSDQYANSVSLIPTGPTTGWVGLVPAYWERTDLTCRGRPQLHRHR